MIVWRAIFEKDIFFLNSDLFRLQAAFSLHANAGTHVTAIEDSEMKNKGAELALKTLNSFMLSHTCNQCLNLPHFYLFYVLFFQS